VLSQKQERRCDHTFQICRNAFGCLCNAFAFLQDGKVVIWSAKVAQVEGIEPGGRCGSEHRSRAEVSRRTVVDTGACACSRLDGNAKRQRYQAVHPVETPSGRSAAKMAHSIQAKSRGP
jgi:hypothetical protein